MQLIMKWKTVSVKVFFLFVTSKIDNGFWQWRMNNFFPLLSELYFLITKFLANGPLQNASEVRILWPIVFRIVSNWLNPMKTINVSAFSGTEARVGTATGKYFFVRFLLFNVYKYSFSIPNIHFSWAIFTCFARVLCVHVKFTINKFLDPGRSRITGTPYDHFISFNPGILMWRTFFSWIYRYFLGESTGRERNMNKVLMNWWVPIKTKRYFVYVFTIHCGVYKI